MLDIKHKSTGISYTPENNPFSTIIVDITHRCNMTCNNCYIPNREIPDLDAEWIYSILARLPKRTRIRLIGAEPTVRKDLPEIIRTIRKMGHLPVLVSNGLMLARNSYTQKLKNAGLRTLHISMNGGLEDKLYLAIDDLACAKRKLKALDNLCNINMFVTVGMIVVPGINENHVPEFYKSLRNRKQVREFHIRNVGPFGRYIPGDQLSMKSLVNIASDMTGASPDFIWQQQIEDSHYIDFRYDGINIQLTDWPDLGNPYRGRLTPSGMLEHHFEHFIANEGGY